MARPAWRLPVRGGTEPPERWCMPSAEASAGNDASSIDTSTIRPRPVRSRSKRAVTMAA